MSPRAACRLEAFGFSRVYDYTLGRADWRAAGLPVEGAAQHKQRVADATRPDVPTCRPDDVMAEVLSRLGPAGWEACVVVDCDGIVVGAVSGGRHEGEDHLRAEEVMHAGPTTVRPDGLLQPLVDRMDHRDTSHVLVTDPQGSLLGILLLDEAKRLLSGEAPQQIWQDCEGCPGQWALTT